MPTLTTSTYSIFSIGTHVDPQILIAKIEPGLVIPNLKHALATIMQDYRLQKDLQEACKKIVESDAYTLITKQEDMQKRGSSVSSGEDDFSSVACVWIFFLHGISV